MLHTHMPYVEGFGTWPFGEEWLWEAITTSYLPILEILDSGAPLTLSLTPVLCDQLEAGIGGRFAEFASTLRVLTHTEDALTLRADGQERLAAELERSLRDYERASEAMSARGADLIRSFAPYAQWTSSATHAILPLLATESGLRAQVRTGIDAHERRFAGSWRGGFWLPECAYAPQLDCVLVEAGVRACCVELTPRYGLGDARHLRPLLTSERLLLVPIDRQTMSLVWSGRGYPAHRAYRDRHRHTRYQHRPWRNDGEPYDHEAALHLARRHAKHFVAATRQRIAAARTSDPAPRGLVVCALDTELLGHWWYEGAAWLRGVVEECSSQGLELLRLDDAIELCEPLPIDTREWDPSSWGDGGDLRTWSGRAVSELAFAQRSAELRLLRLLRLAPGLPDAAARELLALQASDWAFMVSRGEAAPYGRERFAGHLAGFERACDSAWAPRPGDGQALRNLAPHAGIGALRCL